MGLSLRNAAKEAGVSKSTILRAIQGGRLSAERLEDGGYSIDPAELFRVYPPGSTDRTAPGSKGQDAPAANENAPDPMTAVLQEQVNSLRELVRRSDEAMAEARQEREDLKQDRDKWRSMAESQQRLLTDNRPRSWWQRLTG